MPAWTWLFGSGLSGSPSRFSCWFRWSLHLFPGVCAGKGRFGHASNRRCGSQTFLHAAIATSADCRLIQLSRLSLQTCDLTDTNAPTPGSQNDTSHGRKKTTCCHCRSFGGGLYTRRRRARGDTESILESKIWQSFGKVLPRPSPCRSPAEIDFRAEILDDCYDSPAVPTPLKC